MLTVLFQFSAGVVAIIAAGVVLTSCADVIAERTGWGKLLVGSILLAGATSLPELTIGLNAVWIGLPDLGCGDLIGSSLFNLLILAIVDLVHRSRGGLMSRVAVAHSLSGAVTIALTSIVGMGILFEHQIDEVSFLGMGPGAIGILIGYGFGIRLIFFDQRASLESTPVEDDLSTPTGRTLRTAIIGFAIASAVIFCAAPSLANSAGQLAELTGLGGTFVGTTLIALVTSLPEFVATISAARMGARELAIGNIFGSNAFNMLLLVPLDLAFPGSLLAAVSTAHAITCFAVILITAIVILGQLYRVEKRILFIEPDAGVVILLVFGALWMVYLAR